MSSPTAATISRRAAARSDRARGQLCAALFAGWAADVRAAWPALPT